MLPKAVMKTTGRSGLRSLAFSMSSIPSMPGIFISVIRRSKAYDFRIFKAFSAESADVVLYPLRCRLNSITRLKDSSSSTTRIEHCSIFTLRQVDRQGYDKSRALADFALHLDGSVVLRDYGPGGRQPEAGALSFG